ncbi:NAD+ synthase [bacterium]
MKITLAQLNPTIGDFSGNIEKAKSAIQMAENDKSDIICFPEMYLTGYPPRDLLERDDFILHAEQALKILVQFSAQFPDSMIICGSILPNKSTYQMKLNNAAIVILNGKIIFSQSKALLPTYDVFDETRYFNPADTFNLFKWKQHYIGLTICEDAWNDPEVYLNRRYQIDPVEKLVEKGATLIINLSASPFNLQKTTLRYQLIKNHVNKHQIPFVLVNQIGGHDELIFDGHSMVFNTKGDLQQMLPGFKESVTTVEINNAHSFINFNPLPESESLYQALVLGLKDYLSKCGFQKVLIGLSGGIDSSLVACLASEAIGPENVLGIAMPSKYSSNASLDDAKLLADNLNISFKVVPIHEMYNAYLASLKEHFIGMPQDITEENIQARIRGNILMAFSNKFGGLTLATGNKSELSIGYCTMYGDMSGGLSVIGDVPKTMVYQLAHFINRDREIIPQNVLDKPPSAELKPDQKDQDTLPPYDILDKIIDLHVDQMKSYQEIVNQDLDPKIVKWVIESISRNEYKRRQAAPALKVTSKAFGMGRRMPIAAKHTIS